MRRPDTLIVGGGPAGTAAAIALARAGGRPLILERQREPSDTLCGGFLSWTSLQRLESLGVDVGSLGAPRVTQMALFAGRHEARTRLPAPAAALSRKALDTRLQQIAEEMGAGIERGVRVRSLDGTRVGLADGGEVDASRVVLATGKHGFPGLRRASDMCDPVLGLRWRLTSSEALRRKLASVIELHCFRGGYAGLVLQEDGRANLCLAVRRSRFEDAGKAPAALLETLARTSPSLASRLADAVQIDDAQAIANVPYGWRFKGAGDTFSGFYRIGDQAGVIASLSGEGISLALMSGLAAAEAIGRGCAPEVFQPRLSGRLARPIGIAQRMMRVMERPRWAGFTLDAGSLVPSLLRYSASALRVAGDAASNPQARLT